MILTAEEVAAAVLAKPRFGEVCNRCGLCCIWEQCPMSIEMFGARKLCPVLERAGAQYSCGLITQSPPELAKAAGELLGIGTSCDADAPWESA